MMLRRTLSTGSARDPFDLWLSQAIQQRWGGKPLAKDIPQDLLRLACDTRSEWAEMKDRWTSRQQGQDGALD